MANKDDTTGGLLSKVVKFVRNSSGGWSEGEGDDARESSYSKQMLKEMIERKRRNDFVRKREFDMLRKLRRSEVMAGHDPGARPSFFQSSMPSRPDDRASTLKKIDEIEAQMSMQWWKSKHGDANARAHAGSSTNFPLNSQLPSDPARAGEPVPQGHGYSRTAPQPLPATFADDAPTAPEPLLDFTDLPSAERAHAPTEPLPLDARASHGLPPAAPARPAAPVPPRVAGAAPAAPAAAVPVATPLQRPAMGSFAAGAPDSHAASGFSHSKVFAIDVEEFAHDPELEEAAIRFANGDDAGAEAGLREVLAPGGPRADHDETWLTLFDLYRAIGQQERFEAAAIEFAGRFGRSAPQWMSLPEAVGRMGAAGKPAPAPAGAADRIDWTSPSSVGPQTVAALSAALARAPQPWKLSWSKLVTIEPGALEPLAKLFGQWAAQPVQIRFIGADVLERVLRDATPSGDKAVPPAWWKLRMEALRVMYRPDEFELVALDYCVTYEVSPPSWDGARCEFKAVLADGTAVGGQSIVGDAFHDSVGTNVSSYHDTQAAGLSSQTAHVATVELAGQILGDAHETMDLLEGRLHGADVMVISCARLIRIDFSAAGTLLNWASQRQAEGRQLQFVDVHRLVAAFFNVIGISAHARVIARRD
jgi:anti-anti-sigma regulatory factor